MKYRISTGPKALDARLSAADHDAPGRGPKEIPPVGGDDVPDDTSSTTALDADAGTTIDSSIEHSGDQDFFRMELTAGENYSFTLSPDNTADPGGPDLMIEIYNAEGDLVTAQDSGGFGSAEQLNFTPAEGGTYFVNIKGFTAADTGAYSITGEINVAGPNPNAGTPLAAIDWGGVDNRVDTDGVTNGQGDDVIHVYFSQVGEVYQSDLGPSVAENWKNFEKNAAFRAFAQYENIINVDFQEVGAAEEADFVLVASPTAPVLLGRMSPPNEGYEGQGEFNTVGAGWDQAGLQQGGYGFITLIHEFGHGMGLAHPHDNGGGSDIMQGVTGDTASGYTTGDFGLNQGVFTTMSYNDGWPDGPDGRSDSDNYGYQGTMMALDVAMLQQKYGARTEFRSGNDTYVINDVNEPGTFYSCIWDTGGVDIITAQGALGAQIDLRPATLKYEEGGGGWVSYNDGIFGGFTVANGVVIENAKGGGGDDVITGNNHANALWGMDGLDLLDGGKGADRLNGGTGRDVMKGGKGDDVFVFGELGAANLAAADVIFDLRDGDVVDLRRIDAQSGVEGNQAFTLVAGFTGAAGELMVSYNADNNRTFLRMDVDGDGAADMTVIIRGDHADFTDFVL